MWVSADGYGRKWESFDIPTQHNRLVSNKSEKFCDAFLDANATLGWAQTEGYTALAALSPRAAIVCYDRQDYARHPMPQACLVNGSKGNPAGNPPMRGGSQVFCLRFSVDDHVSTTTLKLDDDSLLLPPLPSVTASTAAPCAVIDVSKTQATLHDAQKLARVATASAPCVRVLLGERSFRLAEEPLVLSAADAHTSWEGGEVTTAVDVPSSSWRAVAGSSGSSLDVTGLVNRSE